MWLDILIIAGLLVGFVVSYKCWQQFKVSLREIYQKFDVIYYMLSDIFKKRHERSEKKKDKK
tara:strand:- start:310 stop:495 length:186 start_codon:yes stop_codon:yes gene_type:complete